MTAQTLFAAEIAQPPARPSAGAPGTPRFPESGRPESFELPALPKDTTEAEAPAGARIAIRQVLVEGNTLLPEDDVRAVVAPLENREVTVADIEDARKALTRLCIDRGYLNSGAIIGDGALQDGILRIELRAGRLEAVNIRGAGGLREGYIRNRLLPDPQQTFHVPGLQDRFQRLLADPLIAKMNGRIVPGSHPGLAVLDVDVVRARPYQLSVFTDNYRPPSIGAEVFGLTGWVRNLSGLGDVVDFTFTTGEGSSRYSGGFRVPVTDYGTELFFHFDQGDSSVVEESAKTLHLRSEIHVLEGGISHPFIDSARQRLGVGLLFGVRSNRTWANNLPTSFVQGVEDPRNQVTVLRLFQDLVQHWDDDVLSMRSTLSFGFDALGSTSQRKPDTPSSEFFSWLGNAQFAHRFTDNGLLGVLRGMVQVSDASLLPLERMALGGVGTVRGYRENTLVRDQGYSLSAEVHLPLWRGANGQDRLVLVPFMDYGQAWDFRSGSRTDALHSVGVGLMGDYRFAHAEIFYGHAIDRHSKGRGDDLQDQGVHFQARIDGF